MTIDEAARKLMGLYRAEGYWFVHFRRIASEFSGDGKTLDKYEYEAYKHHLDEISKNS